MTREEFGIIVKGLKAVYTIATFIPDKYAFDVWYEMLKDLDYGSANMSAMKYMSINKFPPTIADIRENAIVREESEELNEMAAWTRVYKGICDANYHASEHFNNFTDLIKNVVRSPVQLREWANLGTEEVNTVIQSNFMRSYRSELSRRNNEDKIPKTVMDMIEVKRNAMIDQQKMQIEEKAN